MSEAELIALEDRAQQAGCTGSSPFGSWLPFAPTNTSISYTTSLLPCYYPVMISSSNDPAGSKYCHVGCHEDGVDEVQIGKRVFHQCPQGFEEQVFHDIPEQVNADEQDFHEDQEQKSSSFVQERCIGEVTEEVVLHRLLLQEEHWHDEDAGGVVVPGQGNRSLPWSDEEEWKLGGSG